MEVAILNIERESAYSCEFFQIGISRGMVDCRYYRAEGVDKGVIMVGGIGGDLILLQITYIPVYANI